ncbi:MAG TPA: hypothetical protein VD978_10750 [Azospirillum sp.]|nr:hypothetical protein [Azospirillum sp.]
MFHRSLLAGFATLALLSAPAMAQNLDGQRAAGLAPSAFAGLVSTNVSNGTNVGAGIGNVARQQATGVQSGSPFGSLVSTNVNTATNVAAGIGNTADQRLLGVQGNGVQVGLNFTGRGPLVSTNVGIGTNVAAGIGNSAGQRLLGFQR